MGAISPGLAERLEGHLDTVVADAGDTDRRRGVLVQSHGDFTFSQLLDHGGQIGLLDFDSLCQAEPGLDLRQFVAYLRLTAAKAGQQDAQLAGVGAAVLLVLHRPPSCCGGPGRDLCRAQPDPHHRARGRSSSPSRARLALSILEESELCH